MRAGIIILLSLAHLGEATFDEELCDAVAKAQNTTITLKQVADSAVKDHDLSVLKKRTLNAMREQILAQGRPYSLIANASDGRSVLDNESRTCIQGLIETAFVTVDLNTGPISNSMALETMKRQYNEEEMKLEQVEDDRRMLVTTTSSRYFLEMLRVECDRSRPKSVLDWLYDQVVVSSRIPNVLLDAVGSNVKAWRSWSHHILNGFHQGISLRQVCMAVAKRRVSIMDMAQEANRYLEKYEEIFEKLIEGERKVKQKSQGMISA